MLIVPQKISRAQHPRQSQLKRERRWRYRPIKHRRWEESKSKPGEGEGKRQSGTGRGPGESWYYQLELERVPGTDLHYRGGLFGLGRWDIASPSLLCRARPGLVRWNRKGQRGYLVGIIWWCLLRRFPCYVHARAPHCWLTRVGCVRSVVCRRLVDLVRRSIVLFAIRPFRCRAPYLQDYRTVWSCRYGRRQQRLLGPSSWIHHWLYGYVYILESIFL